MSKFSDLHQNICEIGGAVYSTLYESGLEQLLEDISISVNGEALVNAMEFRESIIEAYIVDRNDASFASQHIGFLIMIGESLEPIVQMLSEDIELEKIFTYINGIAEGVLEMYKAVMSATGWTHKKTIVEVNTVMGKCMVELYKKGHAGRVTRWKEN